MKHSHCRLALVGLMLVVCCSWASAAVFNLDFETDPVALGVQIFGTGEGGIITTEWRDSGGFNDSGYMSVTDANNGQRGTIVFPDLAAGQALTAFSIEADLRVGGGTAQPADGFSFNFVRPGDPVLDDGEGWAASPTGEANLPEEGSTTGLGIGFDEWFSGGTDVIGMSIRVDNKLVNQFAFPTLNGEVDDQTSLQTGPAGGDAEVLDWARLSIKLCANNLTVKYKDVTVFNQVVEYDATPGRLVFGGRTGGANAFHHIDNVLVKTQQDVGAGCVVIPPSFVAGQGVIGTRTLDGTQSNEVYGPPSTGAGLSQEWYAVGNPGNKAAVDAIFENNDPIVPAFRADNGTSWWSGSDAAFGEVVKYPNEVQPPLNATNNDNYTVRSTGEILIPESGAYRFTDGVDDYTYLAIDIDKSGVAGDDVAEVLIDDNSWTNVFRAGNGGGGGYGEADFTVNAGGEWLKMEFNMAEGGGGDSGIIYWDYNPDAPAGQRVGGGEGFPEITSDPIDAVDAESLFVPDTHLRSTSSVLVSADRSAKVVLERPLEFDVDGATGQSDQLAVDEPRPSVNYNTILDVDGITFQIAPKGTIANGAIFDLINADQVLGTPIITSLVPGQVWTWIPATGQIRLGAGVLGDHNNNGSLDAGDLDLQAAQMVLNPGTPPAGFDLNADNKVNYGDRLVWLHDLKKTWVGDSDLNGLFESADFVLAFQAGKYEVAGATATWQQGDWDGNQLFTSADFVAAFADGGYEAGPRAAVSAVPEPGSIVLALVGLLGLAGLARRR